MIFTWLYLAAAVAVFSVNAQRGSSLRGALEALQRRQQRGHQRPILEGSEDYETVYDLVPPQAYDMDYGAVIKNPNDGPRSQYVIKVVEETDRSPASFKYQNKKKSGRGDKKESAFRERHQVENGPLKDLFEGKEPVKKLATELEDTDAEYAFLLAQLWSKYKKEKQDNDSPQGTVKLFNEKSINKRYPDYWGPIAFKKKRSSGPEPSDAIEEEEINEENNAKANDLHYNFYEFPGGDDASDIGEEYAIAFQPLEGNGLPEVNEEQYSYNSLDKPLFIRKRSSENHQVKRSTQTLTKTFRSSTGTDPKTLKDLSIIFGAPNKAIVKRPVKRSETDYSALSVNSSAYHKEQHNPESHEGHQHEKHGETGSLEIDKPIALAKKSVDWSQYFGIDKRKKKSTQTPEKQLKKHYFDTFSKEVIFPAHFQSFYGIVKRSFPTNMQIEQNNNKELSNKDISSKIITKRSQEFESNAHTGADERQDDSIGKETDQEDSSHSDKGEKLDSKEEQEMKDKLLSQLAAAYSTEKMRKALKDFKQSLQLQKINDNTNPPIHKSETKVKRVAVKKEKVNLMENEMNQANDDDFEGEQGAGHYVNGKGDDQFFERYMGGSGRQQQAPTNSAAPTFGSCPVLSKIMHRCNDVDIIAGDHGQVFLPLCSLHQICYLCGGAPQTTCDLLFLSEADTSCQGDMTCQQSARSALMTLRELHDSTADEMDGECEASPCLLATLKLNINWQRAALR